MKRQVMVATLVTMVGAGLPMMGCGDDSDTGNNQNNVLPDAAVQPDAQVVVDDPLCPLGQECVTMAEGEDGCLEANNVPMGTIYGCHEENGPDCVVGTRCLFLDETETTSACFTYCGECPGTQECGDVTGGGSMGCLENGDVPSGVTTGCYDQGNCPANTSCFYSDNNGTITSWCIERCSPCREGTCPAGDVCDLEEGVCKAAPCTEGSCPTGELCFSGTCIPDIGPGPGPGPGPTCTLPDLECSGTATYCGELIQFLPDNNPAEAGYDESLGYIEYPENGETWTNQYRSFLRRDVVMAIQYAAAKTACKSVGWNYGNGGPLGTIDMSEADGSIPGTSVNSPGHPEGTHTDGYDIDMAYYQYNTSDNAARPVCEHSEGGAEAYHCTAAPTMLDPWRTAFYIAALAEHPSLRVIGVDGQVGPLVELAMETLCDDGWITGSACTSGVPMTYEVTDQGYGWFLFHHHHFHVSFNRPSYKSGFSSAELCLVPGCDEAPLEAFLRSAGVTRAPRLIEVNQSLLER